MSSLPYFISILVLITSFFAGHASAIEGDQIFSLKKSQIETTPGKAETIEISVNLPKGFRAYSDQLSLRKFSPEDYKWGQVRMLPEIEFYDKFSKKNKRGILENGSIQFQVESPESASQKNQSIEFNLRYQICSEAVCYVPKTHTFKMNFDFQDSQRAPSEETAIPENPPAYDGVTSQGEVRSIHENKAYDEVQLIPLTDEARASLEKNDPSKNSFFGFIKFDPENGLVLSLLAVFLAGLLTSFTPCIFPMIPITLSILGHNAEKNSRAKNLSRSLVYVLGIAITYATLGVAAALTGSLFGRLLAHPGVIWSMTILFIALAFSMWGFFEIQAPAFIRAKFQSGEVHGYTGIFGMGLVAGIVASPCVGPVLISILSFVSTTQNVWLGFTYLFVYAIGLGLIFIVIGLFSEAIRLLPKSGGWMDQVKFILGLLMVLAAIYYLQFVTSDQVWLFLSSFLIGGIFVWKLLEGMKRRRKMQILFSAFMIAGSISTVVVSFLNPGLLKSTTAYTQATETDTPASQLVWAPYSEAVLDAALKTGKPTIIDFYADWCAACHELKEKTFSKPGFLKLSDKFNLIVFDATEDTEENQKILTQYGVKGLPTVYFMNKSGEPLNDLTFTQFIEWPELEVKMREALSRP